MADIARVLVVDDSAYVRKVVSQMLGRSPFIEVAGVARDGSEALELVDELRPDVVTCDLNMPVMDGVGFVRAQMAKRPMPIVIISIAAESGELVEKVKAAARWRRREPAAAVETPAASLPAASQRGSVDIVVIGVSTGGPQGLKMIIPRLPGNCPVPVAIVIHMPLGYTEMYAQKLNEMSALRVVEPEEGSLIAPGTVYLAPA